MLMACIRKLILKCGTRAFWQRKNPNNDYVVINRLSQALICNALTLVGVYLTLKIC